LDREVSNHAFCRLAAGSITAKDGVVDKFIGDEAIGLFTPGFSGANHAANAIAPGRMDGPPPIFAKSVCVAERPHSTSSRCRPVRSDIGGLTPAKSASLGTFFAQIARTRIFWGAFDTHMV